MNNFRKNKFVSRIACLFVAVSFLNSAIMPGFVRAQDLVLPQPTQLVSLSGSYSFPILRGMKFDPTDPLKMQFIIDSADQGKVNQEEASALIRYFLAGLTIPESDLWVNMSPYEKDNMITQALSETDLGKDLLSQDYILKQISASLTYPETDTGKDYWAKTYQEIQRVANTTKVPVNTFNKIWIMPDKAVVYENGNLAVVAEATLKTMLEKDYLAFKNNQSNNQKIEAGLANKVDEASSKVMRELILPKINAEVNSGKNFATLRQIYSSLILATWFKKKFQESIYSYYIDKGKVKGIDLAGKGAKDKIYNLYVEAFKKGVYNYVKSDFDPATRRNVKRQYFSGGMVMNVSTATQVTKASASAIESVVSKGGALTEVNINIASAGSPTNNPITIKELFEEALSIAKERSSGGLVIVDGNAKMSALIAIEGALNDTKVKLTELYANRAIDLETINSLEDTDAAYFLKQAYNELTGAGSPMEFQLKFDTKQHEELGTDTQGTAWRQIRIDIADSQTAKALTNLIKKAGISPDKDQLKLGVEGAKILVTVDNKGKVQFPAIVLDRGIIIQLVNSPFNYSDYLTLLLIKKNYISNINFSADQHLVKLPMEEIKIANSVEGTGIVMKFGKKNTAKTIAAPILEQFVKEYSLDILYTFDLPRVPDDFKSIIGQNSTFSQAALSDGTYAHIYLKDSSMSEEFYKSAFPNGRLPDAFNKEQIQFIAFYFEESTEYHGEPIILPVAIASYGRGISQDKLVYIPLADEKYVDGWVDSLINFSNKKTEVISVAPKKDIGIIYNELFLEGSNITRAELNEFITDENIHGYPYIPGHVAFKITQKIGSEGKNNPILLAGKGENSPAAGSPMKTTIFKPEIPENVNISSIAAAYVSTGPYPYTNIYLLDNSSKEMHVLEGDGINKQTVKLNIPKNADISSMAAAYVSTGPYPYTNIYLLDNSSKEMYITEEDGINKRSVKLDIPKDVNISSIAAAYVSTGPYPYTNIYLLDNSSKEMYVLDKDGKVKLSFKPEIPKNVNISSMAAAYVDVGPHPYINLYLLDSNSKEIYVLDKDGKVKRSFKPEIPENVNTSNMAAVYTHSERIYLLPEKELVSGSPVTNNDIAQKENQVRIAQREARGTKEGSLAAAYALGKVSRLNRELADLQRKNKSSTSGSPVKLGNKGNERNIEINARIQWSGFMEKYLGRKLELSSDSITALKNAPTETWDSFYQYLKEHGVFDELEQKTLKKGEELLSGDKKETFDRLVFEGFIKNPIDHYGLVIKPRSAGSSITVNDVLKDPVIKAFNTYNEVVRSSEPRSLALPAAQLILLKNVIAALKEKYERLSLVSITVNDVLKDPVIKAFNTYNEVVRSSEPRSLALPAAQLILLEKVIAILNVSATSIESRWLLNDPLELRSGETIEGVLSQLFKDPSTTGVYIKADNKNNQVIDLRVTSDNFADLSSNGKIYLFKVNSIGPLALNYREAFDINITGGIGYNLEISAKRKGSSSSIDGKGGIDLAGIDVKAAPNSIPVKMPDIDLSNLEGFTFQIIRMQPINNLNGMFGVFPKMGEEQNNTKDKELAYLSN